MRLHRPHILHSRPRRSVTSFDVFYWNLLTNDRRSIWKTYVTSECHLIHGNGFGQHGCIYAGWVAHRYCRVHQRWRRLLGSLALRHGLYGSFAQDLHIYRIRRRVLGVGIGNQANLQSEPEMLGGECGTHSMCNPLRTSFDDLVALFCCYLCHVGHNVRSIRLLNLVLCGVPFRFLGHVEIISSGNSGHLSLIGYFSSLFRMMRKSGPRSWT